MSVDATVILIAATAGAIIGGVIGITVMGCMSCRAANRAARDAWRAANVYYTRKGSQP